MIFFIFDRPKRNILTQQTKKISQPQPIWRILILQFFAQIFIEFVSRQILLHNGTVPIALFRRFAIGEIHANVYWSPGLSTY